jgi:hypothetical protein
MVAHRQKAQGHGVLLPRGEPAVGAAGTDDNGGAFFMRDEPIMVVLEVTYDRRVVCLKRAYIHLKFPLPGEFTAPLYKIEAQQSGFDFERKKEGADTKLLRLLRKPQKRSAASFF